MVCERERLFSRLTNTNQTSNQSKRPPRCMFNVQSYANKLQQADVCLKTNELSTRRQTNHDVNWKTSIIKTTPSHAIINQNQHTTKQPKQKHGGLIDFPQFVCLLVWWAVLFVCMHVCLFVGLFVCLFVLLVCLGVVLFVCLFLCLFVCLFACLLVCLFVCLVLFVCLFVCLLVCLFDAWLKSAMYRR